MIFTLERAPVTGEVADLQKLQKAGIPVAPTVVLDGLEAEFYEHNNLAENIRKAFAGVFGARIDEEKLETASAFAEKLLRESYMFPERADQIKRALPEGQLLVRYSGEAVFSLEANPQAALWAVKRLWASRWQFDAVLERVPNLAPPETQTLIQQVNGELEPDNALSSRASTILDREIQVWASQGKIIRVG